jgi:hypothetical protein
LPCADRLPRRPSPITGVTLGWWRKDEDDARINDWKPEWGANFGNNVSDPKEIRVAYQRVMKAFAEDIGVHSSFVIPLSGRPPSGIR